MPHVILGCKSDPELGAATNSEVMARGRDAGRRMNLSAVLRTIHNHSSISRSRLIKDVGLSRTTVFELLTQLGELGLVEEGPPHDSPGVGRPSLTVRPSSSVGALTLNPEVDRLTVGIATLDGGLTTASRRWVPQRPEATVKAAAVMLSQLRADTEPGLRIVGVGAGIPGQVAAGSGLVLSAPSLGWTDVNLGELMAAEFGAAAAVENNARLVASSELRIGSARGLRDFVYLFAGAGGIGGGIVSDGRILTGKSGFAGEVGWMRIDGAGGNWRSVEQILRRERLMAALGGPSDADDDELDLLVASATNSKFTALADRYLQVLGVVAGNLANVFDPRLILLGGFFGSLYRRYPGLLEAALRATALPAVTASMEMRATSQTVDNVLHGAAQLVFDRLIDDPLDDHGGGSMLASPAGESYR